MRLALADAYAARSRIAGVALRTPLVPSPYLSKIAGRDFLLKLEVAQPIGAFKLRGAANAIAALPATCAGVACCSTGNHGRGIAYAARARGLRAVVCMSELVPQAKVDGIRALGAEVRIKGRSQDEAQIESARLCETEGLAEISPFDDAHVIAGQGTIGLELLEDRPDLGTILIPLSGGGLAAGIALAAFAAAVVSETGWDPTARQVVMAVIGGLWLLVVGWLTVRPFLAWRSTHFVITDRRVMYRHGVLTRAGIDIPLARINSVEFRHGLADRMMRTGTLIIESASQDPLEFNDIPQVEQVHSLLYHEVFDTTEQER